MKMKLWERDIGVVLLFEAMEFYTLDGESEVAEVSLAYALIRVAWGT